MQTTCKLDRTCKSFAPHHRGTQQKVLTNADPITGVSNSLIEELCTAICVNKEKRFKGVYSADEIPASLANPSKKISNIIVNLSPSNQITTGLGHFVSIHIFPNQVKYIDPFGRPCTQPYVLSFLKLCARPVFYNQKQIQNFDSKFCGLYAILYTAMFDRKYKLKIDFQDHGKKSNDAKCIRYLHEIINMRN